ncbi:S8 family serine peptidase [Motilibacter peucedani]|uniref:S8 family serine peptidase n=1 Tax=Motilibacter peucedani TaxID=598650 RepID=UPI0011C415A5|nr:S8 family serine peptidase [Motilibacter peucedani]
MAVSAVAGALTLAPASPAHAGLLDPLLGTVLSPVTDALDTTAGLLRGAAWGYSPAQTPLDQVSAAVGADVLRSRGIDGSGIGVALVDTGVVPVPGLSSGNVVSGPDLSLDSAHPQLRHLDAFGHGTHLAGIIAGRDDSTGFAGVAPGATLLDMRVGASDGAVDVSQVIAAVDWVVTHKNDPGLHVRVLCLAFGTDSTQAYAVDPLAHALESAWRAGITVVSAGGNKGSEQPRLDSPASDPYVIAVGADDTHGTRSTLDDSVPQFSSRGSSGRHVDLLAPGQSIVSLRDPGSYVDTAYPGARVGDRFFKGSGTSQAAAVTAGAAALLLQARPELRPDQVKALLMGTSRPLLLAGARASGTGLLDVAAAAAAPVPVLQQAWPASTGLGSLEAARGSVHVVDGDSPLVGERDIFGHAWTPADWAPDSRAGTAWSDGQWRGARWAGDCWCDTSWAGTAWARAAWSPSWAGDDFAGHDWSSQSWSSQSWSGEGWHSQSWSSQSWSSQSWSGASWPGR